jgi:hypothetical protein
MATTPTAEEKVKLDALQSILEEIVRRLHLILSKHDRDIAIEIFGIQFARKIRIRIKDREKAQLIHRAHSLILHSLKLPVRIDKIGTEEILISAEKEHIEFLSKLIKGRKKENH